MTDDLRTLLDQAAAHVPAPDLAATAWVRADASRRRGRLIGGSIAATAALVVGTVVLTSLRPGERVVPSGSEVIATAVPSGSSGTSGTAGTGDPSGAVGTGSARQPVLTRPSTPADETALPWLRDSIPVAWPERLGFEADAKLPQLSQTGGVTTQVLAVLVREHQQTLHPVVFVPGREPAGTDNYVEIDTVDLQRFYADSNDPVLALGARVIHPDGHRLGFVQPGAVVFVDLQSGAVSRVVIPVSDAERGGFTANGAFVVTNGQRNWRIAPGADVANEVAGPISDAPVEVGPGSSAPGDQPPDLRRYADDGTLVSASPLGIDVASPWASVTNGLGWTAAGVWLGNQLQTNFGAYQGILALPPDRTAAPRLLVWPTDAPGQFKQGATPLRWERATILIYRSDSSFGHRLLAWDVESGKQWRVSELPASVDASSPSRTIGSPLAVVSLAQG